MLAKALKGRTFRCAVRVQKGWASAPEGIRIIPDGAVPQRPKPS